VGVELRLTKTLTSAGSPGKMVISMGKVPGDVRLNALMTTPSLLAGGVAFTAIPGDGSDMLMSTAVFDPAERPTVLRRRRRRRFLLSQESTDMDITGEFTDDHDSPMKMLRVDINVCIHHSNHVYDFYFCTSAHGSGQRYYILPLKFLSFFFFFFLSPQDLRDGSTDREPF